MRALSTIVEPAASFMFVRVALSDKLDVPLVGT